MTSKKSWITRHINDPYVKEAQRLGYASRAAFKLLSIQQQDKIFTPGMTVVDLGAAPGGWSQVARECIGKNGHVIAIDLLPMQSISGVTFIQGDFNDDIVLEKLKLALGGKKADVVISDMSPNLSGQKAIDLPRSLHLLECALDCARQVLKPGGHLLLKVFQGVGLDAFVRDLKTHFTTVKYRKPSASRSESAERYVLAIDFLPGYNNK